ncbi:MAG: TIGR04372 family glycosyltransferase [Rhodospirillaceae bacterium]
MRARARPIHLLRRRRWLKKSLVSITNELRRTAAGCIFGRTWIGASQSWGSPEHHAISLNLAGWSLGFLEKWPFMSLSLTEQWLVGRTPDRPVNIFANLTYRSFGDFVNGLFFVNCVADRFDHKNVTVLYRNDQDYKREAVSLLPDGYCIEVAAGSSYPPIDLVDSSNPIVKEDGLVPWFLKGRNHQDIFITNAMAANGYLWTFDRQCHLRVPEDKAAACTEELVKQGLDPNRWFCTVHAREPGYLDKPNTPNFRDCDPTVFWHAVNHIARNLGGQVVRLGHPAMTPYPPLEGVVDLSRDASNSLLQTFAISRSRFFLGGPSGPSAVADAFHVPSAVADVVDYCPYNDGLVIRTIDLVTPEGRVYRQKDLFDAGYSKLRVMDALRSGKGYRMSKNSIAEVIRLTNFIHEKTADTTGWRTPAAPDPRPRPNQFSWPPGEPIPRGSFLPVDGSAPY